jgi:hypothetical protein
VITLSNHEFVFVTNATPGERGRQWKTPLA